MLLTPPGARFPKWVRIARRSDFQRVYEGGRKCVRRFVVLHVLPRTEAAPDGAGPLPTRLGLTVSRKVGKSHDRNRIRRRLREHFRLRHGHLHPGWDIVVNARVAARDASFDQLAKDFDRCLDELNLIAGPNPGTMPPAGGDCAPSTPPSSPANAESPTPGSSPPPGSSAAS